MTSTTAHRAVVEFQAVRSSLRSSIIIVRWSPVAIPGLLGGCRPAVPPPVYWGAAAPPECETHHEGKHASPPESMLSPHARVGQGRCTWKGAPSNWNRIRNEPRPNPRHTPLPLRKYRIPPSVTSIAPHPINSWGLVTSMAPSRKQAAGSRQQATGSKQQQAASSKQQLAKAASNSKQQQAAASISKQLQAAASSSKQRQTAASSSKQQPYGFFCNIYF